MGFRVEHINIGHGGLRLIEEKVDPPYTKGYDEQQRVGGAVIAFHTENLSSTEGCEDLAVLWDIRVHPDDRDRGLGKALSQRVDACSKARG